MAMIIVRAGKVAIKTILLFAIAGLIFFSIKKLPHATAQTEPAQSEFGEQIGLIEAYREQGRYDEAEQMCQDIITQFPGSDGAFEAQIQLVFLYINWDKPAEADTVLNQVINDFSDHPDLTSSLLDVSGVYIELKKYDEVISLSEYILNNQPESSELIWAQTNLVQSYIDLKDDPAAETAYEQLLSRFSSDEHITAAMCDVALSYWDAGQPGKTRQLYEEAMNSRPDYVWERVVDEIYHKRVFAESCVETGEPQKALEIYQEILDKQPEEEQAIWLIEAYESLRIDIGRDPNVQEILGRFIPRFMDESESVEALYAIGRSFGTAGSNDKAIEIYQALTDTWVEPQDKLKAREAIILSKLALGNELNITQKLDELIAEFADEPDLPEVLFEIGENYGIKAYYWKAVSVWERLIQEFPDCNTVPQAYFLQANYYEKLVELGAVTKAEATPQTEHACQVITENYPDSKYVAAAALKLGQISFEKGQWLKAIQYWELSLSKYPEKEYRPNHILYPLGRAYEELGQLEKAGQAYNEFIQTTYPGDPRIEKVQARLEQIGFRQGIDD